MLMPDPCPRGSRDMVSYLQYISIKYPHGFHWKVNVVILMKFSSLAAPKIVILTIFGAASDEHFI